MKWLIENFTNIILMIIVTSFIIGSFLELITRFLPTLTPDSFFTRLGQKLGAIGAIFIKIGEFNKALLDIVGIPNRLKK